MRIATVMLSFSSEDELMSAEVIASKLLTPEQLESLETGTMYPGNVYYMQIHEPMGYNEFIALCDRLHSK